MLKPVVGVPGVEGEYSCIPTSNFLKKTLIRSH
jgi:hypothetical protein